MFRRNQVNVAALLCLGAMTALPALAQEQLERVEVTGSRIKSIGAVSNSPITSVGAEEIKSSQPVAIEEIIRGLPAASPAIGPGVNNGSGGGATIDLRGLGPNRSLVLVDGRRLVPFDLLGRVDTNTIPLALLQRVDLVTGGASAVYGADAIAGVVNFVLKKNFQGISLDTSLGQSSRGDAGRRRTDLTIGGNFAEGRGNAVISFGTTKTDPLLVGQRDVGKSTTNSSTGGFAGSGTTVPIVIAVTPAAGIPAGSNTLGVGNVQLNPATGLFSPLQPSGTFNTNPPNYFQTPLDRRQLTAMGSFVINDHAEVYSQLFYTRSNVNSVLAASGTFGNSFVVPIGNPFIPEAARQQICSARGISAANCVVGNTTPVTMVLNRRFTELGDRYNDFENKTFQTTVGVRGDLVKGWTYDAYFTTGEADQAQTRRNWGSMSKVRQAMDATNATTCTNTANGCVPLNVFGAEGSITPAMVNFINLNSLLMQKVRQEVAAVSATGDLGQTIKSPLHSQPISLALGLETRDVKASTQSDGSSQIQGEVLGTGAPTPDRSGTFSLKEAYGEIVIPVLQNLPMAHSVNLEGGYRSSKFTTTSSNSYSSNKVGADWAPVKSLRFRAMVQNATRAPNINELFAPQVTGLSNLSVDPCQGAIATPALSALCQATGVPAALIGSVAAPSSGQINVLTGGNPQLGPEKAKTTTVGFVFEPTFVKNLVVQMDYYKINVTDAISSPSTTDILQGCYSTNFNPSLSPNNPACAAIFRSPLTGTFNGVDSRGVAVTSTNQGKFWVSGVDLTVNYGFALKSLGLNSPGRVDLSFNANFIEDYEFQATPTGVRRNCKGYYSNACYTNLGPSHKVKFAQRGVLTVGDFVFNYNWRHQDAIEVEPGSGTWFEPFRKVSTYNYVDVGAVWNVNKNLRVNLSINNLFDKAPPYLGNTIATTSTNGGDTFPSIYDTMGRYFTIGATVKF